MYLLKSEMEEKENEEANSKCYVNLLTALAKKSQEISWAIGRNLDYKCQ